MPTIDPEKWIRALLLDLQNGSYHPNAPRRFPLGKSKGFSRWMTLPDIRDLVVFHAIDTRVVPRALRHHKIPEHVYFHRDQITKAQAAALHGSYNTAGAERDVERSRRRGIRPG